MDFGGLLARIKGSFTNPSVLGNVIQGKPWNQEITRFGGVAPEDQMIQNPMIASPLQAPDEITPGLENQMKREQGLTFDDVLGAQTAKPSPAPLAPPVPSVTPPPDRAADPYYELINSVTEKENLPEHILYNLIKQESGFNPNAKSSAGAVGIAQIVPKWHPEVHAEDPNEAIPYAGNSISRFHDEFGDWAKALAAYNAGGPAVRQYGGIPPYPETQNYVKKILKR